MITREVLKSEIDNVQDQYLAILYNIIKSFEISAVSEAQKKRRKDSNQKEWHQFIDKFAGCLSDDPIKRGNQGDFEIREELE